MKPASLRDRLIVALDVPDAATAEKLIADIGDAATFYKIGMELAYGGEGLGLVGRLAAAGKRVFLDLKLHDIPNTVQRATGEVAQLGATFLTVHAYPQTMRAAVAGARGSGLRLLGVSVLTSMNDADLAEAGYALGVAGLVARRATQAVDAGLAGLVSSAAEVGALRAFVPPGFALVTPGIRPPSTEVGDQKRVATPDAAIRAGADYLVVGRPVAAAAAPRAAAEAIVGEIVGAA